eukprot:1159713-Pelagomonas_calceolata.AAC.8
MENGGSGSRKVTLKGRASFARRCPKEFGWSCIRLCDAIGLSRKQCMLIDCHGCGLSRKQCMLIDCHGCGLSAKQSMLIDCYGCGLSRKQCMLIDCNAWTVWPWVHTRRQGTAHLHAWLQHANSGIDISGER